MKFSVSRKPILLVFPIALASLILFFQNCSPRSSSFAVVGEIGEDSAFVSPVTRSLKVSPQTDILVNEQPIKVLLVVDNSGTMEQSQQNLARSVQQLSTLLQNFDAEIRVVDTTCSGCLENLPPEVVTTTENRTTKTARRFNPTFRKFSISKAATAVQKQTVLNQLSSHITSLGTNGSSSESPIRSLALSLHDDTFFKPGDNALIYVITDENDVQSLKLPIGSFEQNRIKVETLAYTVNEPYRDVPGYTYTRRWYIGRWSEQDGETCGQDDQGRPTGCTPNYNYGSQDYNTLSECQNDVRQYWNGNCGEATHSPRESTGGQSVADLCASARASYPQQIVSCSATTIRVGGPRTVAARVLSDTPQYFLDLDLHSNNLQLGIKEKLSSLFGSNYLIAAQVNKENQSCALGAGQSVDTAFKQFETILPKGRIFRSSICEESAVSGDVLREITTRLSENIRNLYSVELDESERIMTVVAIKGDQQISLEENVRFKFANNVLSLVDLDPTDFDYLEIGIGKKQNWGK